MNKGAKAPFSNKKLEELLMKIAFCAGHGGNNSTAGKRTPDGEYEWLFNDKVAKAFAEELAKYENVELLRTDDITGKKDVTLTTRTNAANKWKADIYISFHHNANTSKWGTWTGVETFVYTSASAKAKKLAEAIHPKFVAAYGLRDRGIKASNLHIVRETNMPAILVEGGFMDSTIDIKKLRNDSVLKAAGIAVAQAVAVYGSLKKKVVKTTTGKTHIVVSGDTLYSLAVKYKTTVAEIKALNGMTGTVLTIGQTLCVATVQAHTVISGDTLYSISTKYKTTVSAIKKLNNLNDNIISIGQVLIIA